MTLGLLSIVLSSQSVDTILVPDINIISTHTDQQDFITSVESESAQSVSTTLDRQSSFFLKTIGPGSSITTSLLGGNASHTALTLNGIPVTNPLIGQLDFSLLPIFFHQGMTINTGLSAKLSETGSIAGTVDIDTSDGERPDLTIGTQTKDYGSIESYLTYSANTRRATYSISLSRLDAKNAYRYPVPELDQVRRQHHAENSASNLYLSAKWILTKRQEVSADYWWHDQTRNIPPTLVQNQSQQSQDDRLSRLGVTHTYYSDQHSIKTRIGYTQQSIDYQDLLINYQNTGNFQTIYLESIAKFSQEQPLQYRVGYQGDYNQASNGGFDSDKDLATHKMLVAAKYQKHSRHTTEILLRGISLHQSDSASQHVSGYLSHQVSLNPTAQLKISARRLWRAPAMNDLYWARGGNPDLLPEQGWESNIGILINKDKALTFTGLLFSRWVDNYILWAPEQVGSPFTASNVSRVWARGIDLETKWTLQRDNSRLTLLSKQSLIYSTPDQDNNSIGLIKNEQLIYIPRAKSHLTASLRYLRSQLTIDLQHTRGYRGINDTLPPYTLVNASLSHQIKWSDDNSQREHQVTVELRGVNLFNQAYSIIERRPMPGTYAELNFVYICPHLAP